MEYHKDKEHDEEMQELQQNKDRKVCCDLWAIAQESEQKQMQKKNQEKTLIVIGDKGSGKSRLVNILKNEQESSENSTYIPTVGLDYQYVRRTNANAKHILHTYEVAGGKQSTNMLTLPISKDNFTHLFYAITLDLSKPHSIIESATFWLEEIRRQFDQFSINNPLLIDQISNFHFAQQAKYETHPDKNRVKVLPIQTILIATKYDLFEKTDAENRKWLSRTLRYLAHINGCSLYFASSKNNELFQNVRSVMNTVLFGNTQPSYFQGEHLRPIMISSSKDELAKMGLPQISGSMTYIEAFKKVIQETFPENQNNSNENEKDQLRLINQFPEARIDSIRAEKDKEMKAISKEFMAFFDQNKSPTKISKKELQQEYEELFETSKSYQPDSQNEWQKPYDNLIDNNNSYNNSSSNNNNSSRQAQNNIGTTTTTKINQNAGYGNSNTSSSTYQSSAPQQIGGTLDPQRVNPYTKNTVRPNPKQSNTGQSTSNAIGQGRLAGLGGLPQIN